MAASLLIAEVATRTTYGLARLQAYTERWHMLLLVLICLAVSAFVVTMYRRDSVELRPLKSWLLVALRLLAFAGVLFYYLDLEKRTERKVTRNSRVLVALDTSLSMGLRDADSSSVPSGPTRLAQAISVLDGQGLLRALRARHDVVLARFDADVVRLASLPKLTGEPKSEPQPSTAPEDAKTALTPPEAIAWDKVVPQGPETRIGQSLRNIIYDERGNPLAGAVVFTDGGHNAGVDPSAAIDIAAQSKLPIFAVGIGSDRRPANARISDLVAPMRAYPGDSFTVSGYVQSHGFPGRSVTVELLSKPASESKTAEGKLEGSQRMTLSGDGEVVPVKFEITPVEKGRRTFQLRVKSPPEDSNISDDQQEADVEIVDRKTKILLIASGPMREYIFLRNQLRRDKQTVVDVWLQSAQEGISQDANKILSDFPSTAPELYDYDCIVAFDPDWRQLDEGQREILERWIAEKAGGLIAVAGPVEMDQWVQDPKMSRIRALYPVEFNRRFFLLADGRFGSETPWPIEFSREGRDAEFLWLGDSAQQSQQAWSAFPGVFGYFQVRGPKKGATVYGRNSDPEAISGAQQPAYLAAQFYGAGQVFYLGSGEMWRLRALDESYFEQFYTKLIRHVSQGRLLLGSSRGMLLVDRDRYQLGNTVIVRAQLSDPQFEPLAAAGVLLQVVQPDDTLSSVKLAADPARKGMFVGQFPALQEGTYRLELQVPESANEQLTRRIQVKMPQLEQEKPERNDALLSELAKQTGGLYYVGADSVLGKRGMPPLVQQLPDRTEITYLAGVRDLDFERSWMTVLLAFICGALFLEWLIRRLSKLA